jgi:hypothetical protein
LAVKVFCQIQICDVQTSFFDLGIFHHRSYKKTNAAER